MADHELIRKAKKLLPDPETYHQNYIDITLTNNAGTHNVITFAKQEKEGKKFWLALPYAR